MTDDEFITAALTAYAEHHEAEAKDHRRIADAARPILTPVGQAHVDGWTASAEQHDLVAAHARAMLAARTTAPTEGTTR